MKAAIINADDFGLSPGVNRGILDAFRHGILTSTTVMAHLPSFDDAVAIAKENPDLPVGVHLSLLWGRPVSDPARVPTLVDRDGCMLRSTGRLARRYFLGRLRADDVKTEFRSQIEKVLEAGLHPTHLDTHKHTHCLPKIMRALIAVADEFEIRKVRLPGERGPSLEGAPGHRRTWKAAVKGAAIRMLAGNAAAELHEAGMQTTDNLVGISEPVCRDADSLSYLLSHLGDGTTEVVCHPGYVDDELKRWAALQASREVELETLKNRRIMDYIETGAVRLTHFGDL